MEQGELERMIVRLVGDGSSFTKMAEGAAHDAESAGNAVEHQTQRIEGLSGGLKNFAGLAAQSLAALGAKHLLGEFQEAFEQREAGMIRLSAALESNGRDVEGTTAQYKKFADQLSGVSTMSAGSVMNLLRQAETFGLTGDAAEAAVRDAAAFEAVTGNAAEAMIRLTAAMAKGDVGAAQRFARMVPQLRGIKDQSEFVAKYQTLVNTGMKTAGELAGTTGGQMQKLEQNITGLKADLGGAVAEGIMPFVQMGRQFITVLRSASPETKRLAVGVLSAVAALFLFKPALAVLNLLFAPLLAALKFVVVDLLIGIPLWIASTAAQIAYSVATATLQAALWLLNAALTATNALVGALLALALVAFFYAVVAIVGALAVTLVAAWKTAVALFDAFSQILDAGFLNNFSVIGEIFGEWGKILKEVLNTARTNMPLAWKLLVAGGKLAVAQLSALWDPLWNFVRDGFSALWTFVTERFLLEWEYTYVKWGLLSKKHTLGLTEQEEATLAGMDRFVFDPRRLAQASTLQGKLSEAAMKFGEATKGLQDTPEVKAARDQVEAIRKEIEAANASQKDGLGNWQDMADSAGKAEKAAEKFDAALVGSAEASVRIANYLDLLAGGLAPSPAGGMGPAGIGGGNGGLGEDNAIDLLGDIRDLLKDQNEADTVNIELSSIV